jgi:Leucine-rich repeat (LRR) protein
MSSRVVLYCATRWFIPLLVLATLLLTVMPTSTVGADSVVTFPDPNLEAAIRSAINKPTGDILQSDLDGLTSYFNASGRGIIDLSGFEHCTNVPTAMFESNQITDLAPLAGLTNLTGLGLHSNQISDLSPLAGLTNLTGLGLSSNQITDVSSLAGLTNLTELGLWGNQITDISLLVGLTNLQTLYLERNQISNLSPLSGLTNLRSLTLHSNQITDISPLSGLTKLTSLYIENNQIGNLSPLSGLTNLTYLDLRGTQLSGLSLLSGLIKLKYLDLQANRISDLSPLSGLTSLTYLYLRWNQISDIQPLVNNTGMASGDTIDLRSNPLSSNSANTCIPALQARGVTVFWDAPAANQAPNQPSNVSPPDGATSWVTRPTLTSTAFSDLDGGDTHAASQWQLRTSLGNYTAPAYDDVTAINLTSEELPIGTVDYSTTYYWHLRYQDNHGAWSAWSAETSFTIRSTTDNQTNSQPPSSGKGVIWWVWVVIGLAALSLGAIGLGYYWRKKNRKPQAESPAQPPPQSPGGDCGDSKAPNRGDSAKDRARKALDVDENADGYQILGVSRAASKEEVDTAFKQKQQGWHPDKFPSPSDKELANEVSKILNNAKDQIYRQRGWK